MSKDKTVCKDTVIGKGVFARMSLKSGEIVWTQLAKEIKYSPADIESWTAEQKERLFRYCSNCDGGIIELIMYAEPYVRGEITENEFHKNVPSNALFFNHSCDPNLVFEDDWTLIAWRDIEKGEELTYDYGTEDFDVHPFECQCGAENCRGKIGGQEWKDEELQKKYGQHFRQTLLNAMTRDRQERRIGS